MTAAAEWGPLEYGIIAGGWISSGFLVTVCWVQLNEKIKTSITVCTEKMVGIDGKVNATNDRLSRQYSDVGNLRVEIAECELPAGLAPVLRVLRVPHVPDGVLHDEARDARVPLERLRFEHEALRAVGLSGAKMRYGRSLAADIVEGRIDFGALDALDDETAIAMLCQAKGIGRWTAEIYLMFAHGRPDIMPGLDLGLVIAAQHLKKLRKRPDAKRLVKIAEQWRPWRSAAALLLWHYRRNMPDWSAKEPKVAPKLESKAK